MKFQGFLLSLTVAGLVFPQYALSSLKPKHWQNNSLWSELDQWGLVTYDSDNYRFEIGELIQKENPAASATLSESSSSVDNQADRKDDYRNAFGVEYGVFGSGFWSPLQPQDGFTDWTYNDCNAFFFCSEEGLYGGLINLSYIRKLVSSGRNSLDLDLAAGVGWQSPVIRTSISQGFDFVDSYRGGKTQLFGLFSIIPTYRLTVFEWLSFGAGAGISYAAGGIPDDPQGQDFNAAAKIEIGLRPFENKTVEATFSFNHRCAFLELLMNQVRILDQISIA